jgi:hypothetical protein
MTRLSHPDEIPQLIEELKRESFYGALRIEFRYGAITRIVTEQSQVFASNRPQSEVRNFSRRYSTHELDNQ